MMEFQTNTIITETHVQVNLRWDPKYLKTTPGVIKAVVIVSDERTLRRNVIFNVSVDKYSWVYLCDVVNTILQRTTCRRMVCVRVHDRPLGHPGAAVDVPVPRHGEVPRDTLAHD